MRSREWGALLRLAHLQFALKPAEFWASSVREWQWLTHAPISHQNRSRLHELMRAFPDKDEP